MELQNAPSFFFSVGIASETATAITCLQPLIRSSSKEIPSNYRSRFLTVVSRTVVPVFNGGRKKPLHSLYKTDYVNEELSAYPSPKETGPTRDHATGLLIMQAGRVTSVN